MMFRKMTLGLLIVAATTALSACHDGRHPRGNGPGGHDRGDHYSDHR